MVSKCNIVGPSLFFSEIGISTQVKIFDDIEIQEMIDKVQ